MNTTKKINVSVSSFVGLRAELLQKHTEVKDAKARNDTGRSNSINIKSKDKKVRVRDRTRDEERGVTTTEDIHILETSKYKLVAKSRLYDKLKKSNDVDSHHYLINFDNGHRESSEDELRLETNGYENTNSDTDDDWVDYMDCFGRTRRCLREDLSRMKEKDFLIEKEMKEKPPSETLVRCISSPPIILSEEGAGIEMMRTKWEKQTEKLSQKSTIHYEDILFDEARTHGVGYYAFSHDEDERAMQQANFTNLRKDTEQKQKEVQEMRSLKRRMEENRLKTAKIRARIRAGLSAEPAADTYENTLPIPKSLSSTKFSSGSESIGKVAVVTHIDESESNGGKDRESSLIVIENKIKAFGELLGKRIPWCEFSQEEWVHKRRRDRQNEFAPVYDNSKRVGTSKIMNHSQPITIIGDADPLQIYAGGPEPTDAWESTGINRHMGGLDHSNECSTVNYSTDSMNIENPPPLLLNPIPLQPLSGGPVSSSPITAVGINFTPVSSVCYSAPSSETAKSFLSMGSCTISNNTSNAEPEPNSDVERSCDSDRSASNMVGAISPSSSLSEKNYILDRIPLPDLPAPTTIRDCSTEYTNSKLEKLSENEHIDKVTAGLKYLRHKFETDKNRLCKRDFMEL